MYSVSPATISLLLFALYTSRSYHFIVSPACAVHLTVILLHCFSCLCCTPHTTSCTPYTTPWLYTLKATLGTLSPLPLAADMGSILSFSLSCLQSVQLTPVTTRPILSTWLHSRVTTPDQIQCCLTSTETLRTIRDGEPRTSTSTFTQVLSSELLCTF